MSGSYVKGQLVTLTATFTVNNVVTDPASITIAVKAPQGVVQTFTYAPGGVPGTPNVIIRDAVGQYHCDITANREGTWYYGWQAGPGVGQSAGESNFSVKDSEVW